MPSYIEQNDRGLCITEIYSGQRYVLAPGLLMDD